MSKSRQLAILDKGASFWNKWRAENPGVVVDLSRALLGRDYLSEVDFSRAYLYQADFHMTDLSKANLIDADLRGARLIDANLRKAKVMQADLREADLSSADLTGANLTAVNLAGANLSKAMLSGAVLSRANLTGTNLRHANLRQAKLGLANFTAAYLSEADLSGADLKKSNLISANLIGAKLAETNFLKAEVGFTNFGNSDLSEVLGLQDVRHNGPSFILTNTVTLSKGRIPEEFLKGCGMSDADIEYAKLSNPDLSNEQINNILYKIYDLRAHQALQIFPLFISYSHGDNKFVDKIGTGLARIGVRYWRDIHDMKSGRIEKQIDRAIRQNPTVLLVLSKNSLNSDWVEHEVRTARELEKEMGRDVLCPVALDGSWKESPWPKRIMDQIVEYNILDFSQWRDDSKFASMFHKLIDGLELFYKG